MRKRDLVIDDQQIPCWQLTQWCPCGRQFGATVSLPIDLFDHSRLNWRDIAARRIRTVRAEIREHIVRDTRFEAKRAAVTQTLSQSTEGE